MINAILQHTKSSFLDLFIAPKKQIPVLDGVRTLAILMVVALHTNIHIMRAGLENSLLTRIPPFHGGWAGVPLFFVLSGFFIGSQLWREFNKKGQVQVGHFILRRGLRIWPLYYVIAGLVLLIFPEKCVTIWSNLLFVANYLGDEGPIRGAWSLSTEEQFYIVIPTLIFVTARFFGFKSLAHYRKLLLISLFMPMVSRAVTWYYLTGFEFYDVNLYIHNIYRPFHTHFDGLVVGLLISNILADASFKQPTFLKTPWKLLFASCVVMVPLVALQKVVFMYSALGFIFGSFVWMCLHSNNFVTRLLSWSPLYWTAKVSFGVYLVHHPVLWALDKIGWFKSVFINPEVYLLTTFFTVYLISCVLCSLTYVLVEAPFMTWRNTILQPSKGNTLKIAPKVAS